MRTHTHLLTAALGTALLCAAGAASAQIGIGISIHIAPPVLPVYEQPPLPAPGYLWTPGYWAYSDDGGYYWVPGTWVEPPQPGLLWTPGYWGWNNGAYVWNEGYWGPTVGYYGGVDYGFGYGPRGYDGGYWRHGVLYYNTAVIRVGPGMRLPHAYNHPMMGGGRPSHVAFAGGPGGLRVEPTPGQLSAAHEHHVMPLATQRQLVESASRNPQMRASFNHGRPGVLATPRPTAFTGGHGAARGEAGHAPVNGGVARGHTERGPTGEARPQAATRPASAERDDRAVQTGAAAHEREPRTTGQRPAAAAEHSAPQAMHSAFPPAAHPGPAAHPAPHAGNGKPAAHHEEHPPH